MITNLHIKNIGIIDDLEIDLNKGMNVLTGETGAGKTLIIDSLQIISGGRFSKDMIRRGENNSFVELCMYDPKNEKSEDGNIIVSREINLNGKNMCKINGRMVTVNELRTFMKEFIEIHGQNDNQNLLDNKLHLQYLDGFIGEKIESNLNKYYILYEKYNKIKSELKANYGDEKEKQRKLDLLKYQFDEIEKAHPDIFNLFLQILEDGVLTDSQGRRVNFRNTVIVMTSNLGAQYREKNSIGFDPTAGRTEDGEKKRIHDAVEGAFRPEFINRLDGIIVFNRLGDAEVTAICRSMLAELSNRCASGKSGIDISFDESTVDYLCKKGYDPARGARPLRRLIEREIEEQLAAALLDPGRDPETGSRSALVTYDKDTKKIVVRLN